MFHSERLLCWVLGIALVATLAMTVFPATSEKFAQVTAALTQVTHTMGTAN
jgi:hypothetical protein